MMNRTHSFFFFIFFLIFQFQNIEKGSAETHNGSLQILDEDVGVFKLQSKIYFLSDLNELIKYLKLFRCLKEKSLLLNYTELTQENFPSLPFLTDSNFKENLFLLDKVLILLKILQFVEDQKGQLGLSLSASIPNPSEQASKKQACQGKVVSDEKILALWKGEKYFEERFHKNSFWVSEAELSQYLQSSQGAGVTKEVAISRLKNRKIEEAVEVFIHSMNRQVTHELFW